MTVHILLIPQNITHNCTPPLPPHTPSLPRKSSSSITVGCPHLGYVTFSNGFYHSLLDLWVLLSLGHSCLSTSHGSFLCLLSLLGKLMEILSSYYELRLQWKCHLFWEESCSPGHSLLTLGTWGHPHNAHLFPNISHRLDGFPLEISPICRGLSLLFTAVSVGLRQGRCLQNIWWLNACWGNMIGHEEWHVTRVLQSTLFFTDNRQTDRDREFLYVGVYTHTYVETQDCWKFSSTALSPYSMKQGLLIKRRCHQYS